MRALVLCSFERVLFLCALFLVGTIIMLNYMILQNKFSVSAGSIHFYNSQVFALFAFCSCVCVCLYGSMYVCLCVLVFTFLSCACFLLFVLFVCVFLSSPFYVCLLLCLRFVCVLIVFGAVFACCFWGLY